MPRGQGLQSVLCIGYRSNRARVETRFHLRQNGCQLLKSQVRATDCLPEVVLGTLHGRLPQATEVRFVLWNEFPPYALHRAKFRDDSLHYGITEELEQFLEGASRTNEVGPVVAPDDRGLATARYEAAKRGDKCVSS